VQPMTAPETEPGIGRQMAKGAAWMVFMRFSVRGLGLVSTIFLARWLVPEDFGVVALSTSVLFAVEAFGHFSFDIALIRNTKSERSHYDTVWTLAVIRGVVLALFVAAIAEPVARLLEEPRLPPIIYWLALTTLIDGFQNVGVVDFRKHMQFRREFTLVVVQKLISLVVTLSLAWMWREYWALVAGIVIGRITGIVMSYVMHSYRPRFCLAEWRELFGFSKWLLLNNIFHFISSQLDVFIIGRIFGAHSVGLYKVAAEISSLPSTELVAPIQRAIFPGFAKLAHDHKALCKSYIDGISILVLLALPAAGGIAVLADPIVRVLLGPTWLEAIPLLQILAINGIIRLGSANAYSVLLAIGRAKFISHLGMLNLVLLGPLLGGGIYFGGLAGAAWALVLMSCIGLSLSYGITLRALSIRWSRLVGAVWRSWAAAAVMAITLRGVFGLDVGWLALPGMQLVVGGVLGAAIYAAAHLALWWISGRPDGAERILLKAFAGMRPGFLAPRVV
jgi:lipopolysaccharide exporter